MRKPLLTIALALLLIIISGPQAFAAPRPGVVVCIGATAIDGTAVTPSLESYCMVSDHFALFTRLDFAVLTLGPRWYFSTGRLRPFMELAAGTPVTGFEFLIMGAGGLEWEIADNFVLSCQAGIYGRFVAGGLMSPYGALFLGYRL